MAPILLKFPKYDEVSHMLNLQGTLWAVSSEIIVEHTHIVAFLSGIGIAFTLASRFCQDFYWPMYSLFHGDF